MCHRMCFEATSHYSWTSPKISSFDDTAREEEAEYLEVVFTPSIYVFLPRSMLICVQVRHGDTHNLIPLPSPASKEQQISVTFTIQPRPRQRDTAGDTSW